jgi:hypothetical protein
MADDTSIYAVNDSGEACMRVSENVTSSDPTSIYGVNEDGKAAVRILGADGGGDQHNLGWYATPEALRTAYATATAGDWAIVGSTDTVWIWDTDTNAWKDSDQKGQVTSVNGRTGDVIVGGLPDQTGHSGEMLTTDGADASWGTTIKPITITPASLYYTGVVKLKGYNNNKEILYMNMTPSIGQFEIDVRNNTGTRTGYYYFDSAFYPHATMTTSTLGKSTNVWANVFTAKINNGSDITVPAVAGEMAVKQVNTTITLTAAGWSNGSQTVNVTGMTATGVVFVSPDPTDQADYTSAGIICSAQAAGTLTFTCSTTPANDIDVVVVML